MAEVSSSPPPQPVSRYRSQRKAQQQQAQETVPDVPASSPPDGPSPDDGVVRSKSRYHRKNAPAATMRQQEQQHGNTSSPPPQRYRSQAQRGASKLSNERHESPPAQLGAQDTGKPRDGYESDEEAGVPRGPYAHLSRSQPTGELFPPPRPEPVQPKRLDGPPTSDKIRATRSTTELLKYADAEDDGGGCFGLFKRKRGEASPQALEKTPIARPNGVPPIIKAGGEAGGIVPGTDAPVSAVNAGDRRVLVECGKSKTVFPVTPTTTPVDLIKSAANCMSERIDVRSAVLLEYFGTVGVQRPLRRYEHIRDVMNSWDGDKQNSLLLVDPGTGSSEAELSIAGVPREKPAEASWILQYSQKPGKWDKRQLTVRPDGQVTLQRDYNKPQNQENVCHLSDFDIYTPSQEKLRKKIKPPKKYCFAIKSQQKTSMFESMATFVHFVCTNEKRTADDFYAAVQGWRSWYLVNVMGEGKKANKPAAAEAVSEHRDSGDRNGAVKTHRPVESFDSHYQLGSFRPLSVDMVQVEKQAGATKAQTAAAPPTAAGFSKSASQFDTTVSPERRTSTARRNQHPPAALGNKAHLAEDEPLGNFARRASLDGKRTSLDQTRPLPDEFMTNGRNQFQRQPPSGNGHLERTRSNEASGYNNNTTTNDNPRRTQSTRNRTAHKTTTSGELNRIKSIREAGGGRDRGSVDLGRSGSTRVKEMPKPLVDLTPQYREPPQHAKKGKGHYPDQPGTLIDAATSPEDPIGLPPSTDWRGRNGPVAASTLAAPVGVGRAHSNSRSAAAQQRPSTSRSRSDGPFTGEGLLGGGQTVPGWTGAGGGGERGRGDGSRVKGGPLVDLSEPSRFAPGSLLHRAERA